MPKATAIDVILRPDKTTQALAIRLSRTLPPTVPYRLNQIDRLPHLSLWMMAVDQRGLNQLTSILAHLAKSTKIVTAQLTPTIIGEEPPLTLLDVLDTATVQHLHEAVADACLPYSASLSADANYVLDAGELLRPDTKTYTDQFAQAVSFEHYRPHITIGKDRAEVETIDWPMQARFPYLAVCQLGNYNTCRKVLAEWPLK